MRVLLNLLIVILAINNTVSHRSNVLAGSMTVVCGLARYQAGYLKPLVNRVIESVPWQIPRELALKIETAKSTYVVGEPITIVATLTNTSSQPVAVYLSDNFLHIVISNTQAHFRRFVDEEIVDTKPKKQPFNAGKSWMFQKILLRGVLQEGIAEEYILLPATGKYRVRAKYYADKDVWVDSNEIGFEVVLPKGEDAEAWRQLQDQNAIEDYTKLLKYGGPTYLEPRREQIVEQLYRVVEKYPKSIYAETLTPRLLRHFEERINERASPALSEKEKTWYETLRARRQNEEN